MSLTMYVLVDANTDEVHSLNMNGDARCNTHVGGTILDGSDDDVTCPTCRKVIEKVRGVWHAQDTTEEEETEDDE